MNLLLPLHTASIPALLDSGCPSDVSRFVSSVHIDTIKRKIRTGARTNVPQERFERVSPFRAHINTAAPVVLESLIFWVCAARLGVTPRAIFRGIARVAMLPLSLMCSIRNKTAAAFRVAASEISDKSYCLIAAIAKHQPSAAFVMRQSFGPRYCDKSRESQACDIERNHGYILAYSRHVMMEILSRPGGGR